MLRRSLTVLTLVLTLIALALPAAAERKGKKAREARGAAAAWAEVGAANRACLADGVQQNGRSIEQLIAKGIGPADPWLSGLWQQCQRWDNVALRANVACPITQGATVFTSFCRESLVTGNGTVISRDEAKRLTFSGTQISVMAEERDDARARRLQMAAEAPEARSVPAPNFDCAKAKSPSELAVCGSYRLALLDGEFGALYRRAVDLPEGAAAKPIAKSEYAQTEACQGDIACIRASKETGIDALAIWLRGHGQVVETSLDAARAAEAAADAAAAAEAEARAAAEAKAEADAAAAAAAAKAEADARAAAEAAAAAEAEAQAQAARDAAAAALQASLAGIDAQFAAYAPGDILILQNTGPGAPNLARDLDGNLVSTTGAIVLCRTDLIFDRTGEEQARYLAFVEAQTTAVLGQGLTIAPRPLAACTEPGSADYLAFQKAALPAAPPAFLALVSQASQQGFVLAKAITRAEAKAAVQQFQADLAARRTAEAQRAVETAANLLAGTATGLGVIQVDGPGLALCHAAGDSLPDGRALTGAEAAASLSDILGQGFGATRLTSATPAVALPSMNEVFFDLSRNHDICAAVLASGPALTKLTAAMTRDGLAFTILPWWSETGPAPQPAAAQPAPPPAAEPAPVAAAEPAPAAPAAEPAAQPAAAPAPAPAADFGVKDAAAIRQTFSDNMARFDRDYRGKSFAASGRFQELSPAMVGDYYATFVAGMEEFYCSELEKGSDEVNQLIDASSGQSFEITGRIKSVWFDNVELEGCRLR